MTIAATCVTLSPMSQPDLFTRIYRYLFDAPPPKDVWQTTSTEFLRGEKVINCDWFGYTHYDVYALRQKSLTTGKTRIVEDWRLS